MKGIVWATILGLAFSGCMIVAQPQTVPIDSIFPKHHIFKHQATNFYISVNQFIDDRPNPGVIGYSQSGISGPIPISPDGDISEAFEKYVEEILAGKGISNGPSPLSLHGKIERLTVNTIPMTSKYTSTIEIELSLVNVKSGALIWEQQYDGDGEAGNPKDALAIAIRIVMRAISSDDSILNSRHAYILAGGGFEKSNDTNNLKTDQSSSSSITKDELQVVAQAAAQAALKAQNIKGSELPSFHSSVDHPSFHRPETRSLYALVIGVEHYPKPLPPAFFSVRDAKAVRSTLLALGVPTDHLKFLTDDTASGNRIKGALSWLKRNVKPGSTVWVYFSGHGSPSERGTAYLVPFDGDPADLSDTGYRVSDFYHQLDSLPAKHIIVALDACFTGEGGRSIVGTVRPLITKIREGAFPSSGKLISFTASRSDQEAGVLQSQGHGLFTYYFLKGLDKGAVRNGHVTVSQLFAYLKRKVERKASLDNRTQVPELDPTLSKEIEVVRIR